MLQGDQKSAHKVMKYTAEVNGGLNDRGCQQRVTLMFHVCCIGHTQLKNLYSLPDLKKNIWSDERMLWFSTFICCTC